MKTILIFITMMVGITSCQTAPINFCFDRSVSDTNNDGVYYLTAIPTNAPDPRIQFALTNGLSGVTNFLVDSSALPAPTCFVFVSFSNSTGSTASTPLYFDYAAFAAPPPKTNAPPSPPRPRK
jgi:hypothetical protein